MRNRRQHIEIGGDVRAMQTYVGDDGDNDFFGDDVYNVYDCKGGDDYVAGGDLRDFAHGGEGDDKLVGDGGDDLLYGDGGGDFLIGGSGDDNLNGGDFNLVDTDDDRIDGGGGDDLIGSYGGVDDIDGGSGDDLIAFADGSTVEGGTGDDIFDAYSNQNQLSSTVHGGAGDDVLIHMEMDTFAIYSFYGDAGEDTIDYSWYTASGVLIDLSGGYASANQADLIQLFRVEDAIGTDLADTLIGDGAYNTLEGGDGDDSIAGRFGGDWLDGGNGIDTLDYSASGAALTLNLLTNTVRGGDADGDHIIGFERYVGTALGDSMVGNLSSETFVGGGGRDSISGGKGDDTIDGGTGSDILTGGLGVDLLTGGVAADTFVYAYATDAGTYDEITDFNSRQGDRIDFGALDADPTLAGNQTLTFLGTAAFDGAHGELRVDYVATASRTYALVTIDLNGDKAVDMTIYVDGITAARPLVAGDFVL